MTTESTYNLVLRKPDIISRSASTVSFMILRPFQCKKNAAPMTVRIMKKIPVYIGISDAMHPKYMMFFKWFSHIKIYKHQSLYLLHEQGHAHRDHSRMCSTLAPDRFFLLSIQRICTRAHTWVIPCDRCGFLR